MASLGGAGGAYNGLQTGASGGNLDQEQLNRLMKDNAELTRMVK